jgi:hypothetical protein
LRFKTGGMDFLLPDKLTRLRLQQSLVGADQGHFRLGKGRAVELEPGEGQLILDYYNARTHRTGVWLRRSLWLQVPFTIGLLVLTLNIDVLNDLVLRLDDLAPGVMVLVFTLGWPLAALWRHIRAVESAVDEIHAELAQRPVVKIGEPVRSSELHALERLLMIFMGPGVFIDLYGSINPEAYRNTPFLGRQLGWTSLIALLVFGLILWRHRKGRPTMRVPDANLPE